MDSKSNHLLYEIRRSLEVLRGEVCCKLREMNSNLTTSGSTYRHTTTADANEISVSADPGTLEGILINNTSGSTIYVKLYEDVAPTSGDTPFIVFTVAATSNLQITLPSIGYTVLGMRVTGGVADADATAVSAGSYITIIYK